MSRIYFFDIRLLTLDFFSFHFLKKEYNKNIQKNFCITHTKIVLWKIKK